MRLSAAAALAALLLAGCNASGPMAAAPAPAPASLAYTPSDFHMPAGSGCGGDIARYRAVTNDDLATGNVNQSVYDQIHRDILEAEKACAAGKDGAARAIVASSRHRHGY